MSVCQPVDLDSYSVGEYEFRNEADRILVDEAIADGKDNTSTYQILVSSLCLDPQQTAEAQIKESCHFLWEDELQQPATSETTLVVPTPSVACEVAITDNPMQARKDRY
eukprot:GHVU01080827.1.p1 GENE.GHVU01080827.1~~GHVU01080827.1.p1  ORF type:complete len:109 (-),score=10.74 GHVU01080827.1:9-335(-)